MKKIIVFPLILFVFLAACLDVIAQKPSENSKSQEVLQAQPIIMVIPFTKQNEDCRTILDSFVSMRVAIIKMQEAFNEEGFTTVDFKAALNARKVDDVFTKLDNKGAKEALIEASGADMYVEVEANQQSSGTGNSVRLNLVAYDAFTGRNLASKTTESPKFRTDNYDKLVEKCLFEKKDGQDVFILKDFLTTMQEKFSEMIENGRFVKVMFTLDQNSTWTFDDEVTDDGDNLGDLIINLIDEKSFKNQYSDPRITDNELLFLQVAIPLRDDRNRNYKPSKFAQELRKTIYKMGQEGNALGFKVSDDVRGGTIYFTLK